METSDTHLEVQSYDEQANSGALKLKLVIDPTKINGAGRPTILVPSLYALNKTNANAEAHNREWMADPLALCTYNAISINDVTKTCDGSGCNRTHVITDADERWNNGIPSTMDKCDQCNKLFCLEYEDCKECAHHIHCN